MDVIQYKKEIELLKKQVGVELTSQVVGDYERILVLSAANFSKVMPDIPEEDYENLCRQNFFYKRLSGIQLQYLKIVQDAKVVGNLDFIRDNSIPRIFCTFHMGSYRLMNLILGMNNINFVLVISSETLKGQKKSYLNAYEELKNRTGTKSTFEFIEAEKPSSMLSMVKALKKGKSLLFYIDGNTGVGGIGKTDDKMLPVSLFKATIYARKGITYLAHKCGIPIINCFSYIENNEDSDSITVQFNDPIYPDQNTNIQDFCQSATQKIYDEFSDILRKYPSQWEGWMYIHRYMDLTEFNDLNEEIAEILDLTKPFVYNKKRFSSFQHGEQKYLFDKITYNTYPVDKEFMELLQNTSDFYEDNLAIPDNVFRFLVNKKIIIPSF